mmetsp:Transcript_18364/g.47274  ORF Transcript_18364/g.47274 Transcript_18364/m.47274 type:complete len:217 (-) Transcript_18364:354-1004(-)
MFFQSRSFRPSCEDCGKWLVFWNGWKSRRFSGLGTPPQHSDHFVELTGTSLRPEWRSVLSTTLYGCTSPVWQKNMLGSMLSSETLKVRLASSVLVPQAGPAWKYSTGGRPGNTDFSSLTWARGAPASGAGCQAATHSSGCRAVDCAAALRVDCIAALLGPCGVARGIGVVARLVTCLGLEEIPLDEERCTTRAADAGRRLVLAVCGRRRALLTPWG